MGARRRRWQREKQGHSGRRDGCETHQTSTRAHLGGVRVLWPRDPRPKCIGRASASAIGRGPRAAAPLMASRRRARPRGWHPPSQRGTTQRRHDATQCKAATWQSRAARRQQTAQGVRPVTATVGRGGAERLGQTAPSVPSSAAVHVCACVHMCIRWPTLRRRVPEAR